MMQRLLNQLFGRPNDTGTQNQSQQVSGDGLHIEEIDKQLKRLSKEVYKANTLTEAQLEQTKQALAQSQEAYEELSKARKEPPSRERLDLIKALFPVIDSIEAGIESGKDQIQSFALSSPDAAQTMARWLEGQRLLLDRLQSILESAGVRPLDASGQLFDPYKHVALKTAYDPARAEGAILRIERQGYVLGDEILRYAEVVVNKKGREQETQ
jgi:molecular chaperone GrpE